MAAPFNARAARTKRPCPLWIDAFQRDTQHLEADEVGAYLLILMAMWTRESCDFPNDDTRLARVSRVSVRLWKSRIGPALRPFFGNLNGALVSKRLREEATYVERQVTQQSDRKSGENAANSLKPHEPAQSADVSAEPTAAPSFPTTQQEEREAKASLVRPARFGDFWNAYPHRGGAKRNRKGAEAKYAAAVRRGIAEQDIIEGARRAHGDRRVIDGYARDPTTWLTQEGWRDEIEPNITPFPSKRPQSHGERYSELSAALDARLAERPFGSGDF
jgi:uncharacterized protein YdaU (DUF1376 family)